MIRALLTIAIISHIFFAYAQPALAQSAINDEGAAHLKTMFQEMLDNQKELIEASGTSEFTLKGALSVEKEDTYYAVTLPHISINNDKSQVIDIGILSINAQPHDQDGQWKITLALPTPLTFSDKETGKVLSSIETGRQSFSGIWDESIDHFTKLDAHYQDIAFSSQGSGLQVNIPNASILYDLSKNQGEDYSGPMQIALDNLNLSNTENEVKLSFEKLAIDINFLSYNPASIKKFKEETKGKTPSKITFIDLLATLSNEYEVKYNLKNLDISFPKNTKNDENALDTKPPMQSIHLDNADIQFDISGFSTDKAHIRFKAGYNGKELQKTNAKNTSLTPTAGNFDLALSNIPFLQLTELGKQTMENIKKNPSMGQMAGFSILIKIPGFLSQAGTKLTINDNYIANDSYKLAIDGTAKADITAKNSATLDANISIDNMIWFLSEIEKQAKNPDKKDAKVFKSIFSILNIVKDLAQENVASDGSPVHIFDLIMGKDGKMMVNGLDTRAFTGDGAVQSEPLQSKPILQSTPL